MKSYMQIKKSVWKKKKYYSGGSSWVHKSKVRNMMKILEESMNWDAYDVSYDMKDKFKQEVKDKGGRYAWTGTVWKANIDMTSLFNKKETV